MQINTSLIFLSVLILTQCSLKDGSQKTISKLTYIDVQGHRGCRGLLPENTIPAFLKAMELGVTTLELDLVISKDKKVIVSHEPFFNNDITTLADGSHLTQSNERKHNIYTLTRNELKAYDVGLKKHPKFSSQVNLAASKPTLEELVDAVRKKSKELNKPLPFFNVEIKRVPVQDGEYHPDAHNFAQLVIDIIHKTTITDHTYIQSFDIESLEASKKIDDSIPLVLLIANEQTVQQNLNKLSFKPDIYSPYFQLVNRETIKLCREKNIKLIPWTVNKKEDMLNLLELGVDGIISDYPDLLIKTVTESGFKVKKR
jgi:glycerophosphoryl diester phosphodiesterase